jgi:hypothetical protein
VVQGLGVVVKGSELTVQRLELRFRVNGAGFRVWDTWLRLKGLGLEFKV